MAVITWKAVDSLKFCQILPFPYSSESPQGFGVALVKGILAKSSPFGLQWEDFEGMWAAGILLILVSLPGRALSKITPYLVVCCPGQYSTSESKRIEVMENSSLFLAFLFLLRSAPCSQHQGWKIKSFLIPTCLLTPENQPTLWSFLMFLAQSLFSITQPYPNPGPCYFTLNLLQQPWSWASPPVCTLRLICIQQYLTSAR